jgi:hypothetical protein
MIEELEDARKLGHGTYADVIVVEHRKRPYASSTGSAEELRQEMLAPYVVLELPEGTRVIDKGAQYEIDGVLGSAAPSVGVSYRVIVAPATEETSSDATISSLRYETMGR